MTLSAALRCCTCVIVFLALYLEPAVMHSAGNSIKSMVRHKVSSMGFPIGDVTTTQRMTEEGGVASLHFETRTVVKASFLWLGYQQNTTEKGTIQNGNLVSYSRKGTENGTTIDIIGQLKDSYFRFEVRELGARRSVVIARSSYDYTTMECPEARLDFSGQPLIILRILDVEKMAVVKREYFLVRNANYEVAGKEYPCRIVDFTDQNKKARRWIGWDGTTVVMYRQDSRGEKNSYSVKAASVAREM